MPWNIRVKPLTAGRPVNNKEGWKWIVEIARDGEQAFGQLIDDYRQRKEALGEQNAAAPLLDLDISFAGSKRSLDQNRTHWGLCRIMSLQQEGNGSLTKSFHEAQLAKYSDQEKDTESGRMLFELVQLDDGKWEELMDRPIYKRSHDMSTGQMARLIEGDFRELAEMGIPLLHATQYHNYMIEFHEWRAQCRSDPLKYDGVEDYRARCPWCEACSKYLGGEESGHMAHIVTKARSGLMDVAVLIHLCPEHHTKQHNEGWEPVVAEFPHIKKLVKRREKEARELMKRHAA